MMKKEKVEKKKTGISSLTTRELRKRIREQTKEANKRITEYREKGIKNEGMEKMIRRLVSASKQTVKKGVEVKKIFAKTSLKRKNELQYQYRILKQFMKFDRESVESERQAEKYIEKQYYTFRSTYPGIDISIEDYKDMVDQLGSIGEDVLGAFNYMGALEQYADKIKAGKHINLVTIFNKAKQLSEGHGWTTKDIEDYIVNAIQNETF